MRQFAIKALALIAFASALSAQGIDPKARKDIDAGNQAWVTGMKEGRAEPIAATYAEDAIDCTAAGDCIKGRAAIAEYMRNRIAKSGRATSATAATVGSVQQGDFVYEWGRSELSFAGGQKSGHRYLTVWQRQKDGVWRIFRNMPIPDDAAR